MMDMNCRITHIKQWERPDYRYGSTQVAAVSQDHPDDGSSQCQRKDGQKQWVPKNDGKMPYDQRKKYQDRQKYTYEMMLDQPCKFHTPSSSKPANHTTRQYTWFQKGDIVDSPNKQLPPPPPPPLTGGNAQAVGADNRYENRQPRYQNQERREAVHQVHNPRGDEAHVGHGTRNEYREHHQSYVVFVTEPNDKKSQQR